MNRTLLGGLVALVSLLGACGSDEEDAPATIGSYAAAQCAVIERCYPSELPTYGGSARCAERLTLAIEAETLPGMSMEGAWLSGCISSLQSASCDDLLGAMKACQMPAGTLPEGSACSQSAQCDTSLCKVTYPDKCGTCIAPAALDEPCGNEVPCVPGLSCSAKDKVCIVPAALDEPCDGGIPCGPGLYCSYKEPSYEELVCIEVPDSGSPYSPDAPKVGDACTEGYNSCGSALRCHKGVCALPVQLGETCGASTDCVSGAFCDSEKKLCTTVKRVGAGQACDAEGVDCLDGLYCKGGAVCVGYVEDGGECDSYSGYGAPGVSGCLYPALCEQGVCTLPTAEVCE